MNKKRNVRSQTHYVARESPEIIRACEISVAPGRAVYGMPTYFAILAYPDDEDLHHRVDFITALLSWACKNARKNGGLLYWENLSAEIRQMRNQSIGPKLHMGLKRIEKRLKAGLIAHKIWVHNRILPSANPTTATGKGLAVGRGGLGVGAGAYTVTHGLKEILLVDNEDRLVNNEDRRFDRNEPGMIERDVLENHRTAIWTSSLPVLHIATSLEFKLESLFGDIPRWAKVHRLIHDATWLQFFVDDSTVWRHRLASPSFPGFDENKALIATN